MKIVKIIVITVVILALLGSCVLGIRSYIDFKHQIDAVAQEQADRYGSVGK
jgi:uncharacterized protein YpmB